MSLWFKDSDLASLREQLKEQGVKIGPQKEAAPAPCQHCERLRKQLKRLSEKTNEENSIGKILRRWYPEDYQK